MPSYCCGCVINGRYWCIVPFCSSSASPVTHYALEFEHELKHFYIQCIGFYWIRLLYIMFLLSRLTRALLLLPSQIYLNGEKSVPSVRFFLSFFFNPCALLLFIVVVSLFVLYYIVCRFNRSDVKKGRKKSMLI